ncbi:hypothetical protein T439DRAFT_322591 [Meredithblackwellia eburnea MCA 4105]
MPAPLSPLFNSKEGDDEDDPIRFPLSPTANTFTMTHSGTVNNNAAAASSSDLEALRLPFLVFSSSLHLLRSNSAAKALFGHFPSTTPHASWFFRQHPYSTDAEAPGDAPQLDHSRPSLPPHKTSNSSSNGVSDNSHTYSSSKTETAPIVTGSPATSAASAPAPSSENDFSLSRELYVLAKESHFHRWGDSSMIEYWTGSDDARVRKRAEALVQLLPQAPAMDELTSTTPGRTTVETFAITLVRPLPTKHTISSSFSGSKGNTSSTSLSASGLLPPVSSPSEPHLPVPDPKQQLSTILNNYVEKPATTKSFGDYKNIVDEIPQIIFTADKNGSVELLNRQWYTYTGVPMDGTYDMGSWTELFHPADLPTALAAFGRSIQTGDPINMEYRVRSASGDWRWFVARGVALRDPNGDIKGWVAALTDVEELVRVRSDALQIRSHVMAVLAGADIVLFSVDMNHTINFFEGNYKKFAGHEAVKGTEVLGQPLDRVWPEAKLISAVDRVLSEGLESLALLADTTLEGSDRKNWYRYRLVPLRGPTADGTETLGVIIVAANVTDLVEAEEALQRANFQRAQLLASETAAKESSRLKTEFTTTMSHEVRTPIAAMMGICELLLDDSSLEAKHRKLVDQCLRCGEILLNLVGTILDLGKIEANELKLERAPITLSDIIKDARLFSFNAQKVKVTFHEDIDPNLYHGPLIGDRLRLQQVLGNGLSNALKFTKEKEGQVSFRVRQGGTSPYQSLVTFEIEDTGVGIESHILPTLFTPFRQADSSTARVYGGSGLGLVIAKRLVELMGGTITLESELGKGTIYRVHLAFDKATEEDLQEKVQTPDIELDEAGQFKRREDIKILLAEDNELIREIVGKTLRKMNFNVTTVDDGEAAVKTAEEGTFDLILMDGQMPRQDGYQATAKIRQSSNPQVRSVKIIALTASAVQGDKERCLEAGMDGYLPKPVRAKALEKAICSALAIPLIQSQ